MNTEHSDGVFNSCFFFGLFAIMVTMVASAGEYFSDIANLAHFPASEIKPFFVIVSLAIVDALLCGLIFLLCCFYNKYPLAWLPVFSALLCRLSFCQKDNVSAHGSRAPPL